MHEIAKHLLLVDRDEDQIPTEKIGSRDPCCNVLVACLESLSDRGSFPHSKSRIKMRAQEEHIFLDVLIFHVFFDHQASEVWFVHTKNQLTDITKESVEKADNVLEVVVNDVVVEVLLWFQSRHIMTGDRHNVR